MTTIYIDITDTQTSWLNTGIQRTVRNIARHLPELAPRCGFAATPVVFRGAAIHVLDTEASPPPPQPTTMRQQMARRIVMRILNRIDVLRDVLVALSPSPAWSDFVLAPRYRFGLSWLVVRPYVWLLRLAGMFGRPVRAAEAGSQLLALPVATGDILLLADSTWSSTNVWPGVAEFRHRGGRVAMVVYDLIPMSHPQYCNRVVVNAYSRWIRGSLPFVDFYACISRFTERELLAHLQGLGGGESRTPPCTGYFHLGSDLDLISAQGTPSQEVRDLAASGGPMFLAVGSLEPRKNIAFILDAFDRVWARMPDASLVIVGHNAWKIDKLIDRIRQHPRYGCGLHWLRDASDTDLEFLYAHSNALIFASVIEGFGLPIVEAMQRGLPVLCSDIPVFREIADGKASFFSLATTDELVAAVARVASEQANGTAPERRPYPWAGWRESTDILLDMLAVHFQPEPGIGDGACG